MAESLYVQVRSLQPDDISSILVSNKQASERYAVLCKLTIPDEVQSTYDEVQACSARFCSVQHDCVRIAGLENRLVADVAISLNCDGRSLRA